MKKFLIITHIVISAILLPILVLTSCSGHVENNTEIKEREEYSFEINNNIFSGLQSDQEMGDYQICFYGDIVSFSGLTIGKGIDEEVWKEWLQINDDKVTVLDVENQVVEGEYEHNLEFKDYIAVNIIAGLNGKADVEIMTNGGSFSKKNIDWIARNGRVFAEGTGGSTVLQNCTLSYYCNGWDKSIWLYGDSYFSMNEPNRWTTYLIQSGATDILLSGRSGEGSEESLEAFKTQLQYGTPKTIIWCVGMNDGDKENVINQAYKDCLNKVIEECKEKDIELILATIPTCPYWLNDYKNEYIKGLGYKTVDFAEAVGSYDSITWKDNMLEDGESRIHPTINGALAMYSKAVSTVPELLKHQ